MVDFTAFEVCENCNGDGCESCNNTGFKKIIKNKNFEENVLGNGHVMLLDVMGNDFTPVERARVSYNNGLTNYNKDVKLLKFLYQNGHLSPLEGILFEWELKIPIFVARHLMRYRTASYNELSGRYSDKLKDEYYLPKTYRMQDKGDKQSSVVVSDDDLLNKMNNIINDTYEYINKSYKELESLGVAKELARIIQPVGQFTSIRMTINLRNLLHIFEQRMTQHAQLETREVVTTMYNITKEIVPLNIDIFTNMMKENNHGK